MGITATLGIPYTAPPIGPRRWQAPEPPLTTGPRSIGSFAPAPPQPTDGAPGGATLPGLTVGPTDEDCLTLNVWGRDGIRDAPVLVWVPGGAFVTGGAGLPIYDGRHLAALDVVVVTVTYRVGALGFAAVDGCPPNRGLLDQVKALQWVRDHVEEHGGDPANVTVFGESAGGGSVLHLMATPAARGLFRCAIVQSGATDYTLDPTQAASVADRFVTALGGDLVAPVEAILAAQQEALFSAMADVGPMPFHPFVDGDVLASRPIEALPSSDVDLLIGTTRDEMRMYLDPNAPRLDRERLVRRTARYLSTLGVPDGHAEALLAHYDDDPYLASPDDLWSAIQTDREMRRPMHTLADAHTRSSRSTYVYRYDEPLAGPLTHLRACHASDLPFTFGTVVGRGVERRRRARRGRGRPLDAGCVDRVRAWRRPVVRAARCVARLRHRPARHDAARRRVAARRRSRGRSPPAVGRAHADADGLGAPTEVAGEEPVATSLGLLDAESGPLDHRLEQPREGAVLVAHVLFELRPGPVLVDPSLGHAREPGLERRGRVARVEPVDDVPQPQQPTGGEHRRRPARATAFQRSGRWCSAYRLYTRSAGAPVCS